MANLDDELRAAVQPYDDVPVTKAGPSGAGTTEPRRGGSVQSFEATHNQPQCPAKYEEAQRRGEVMPHASVQ